jgi:hypothetical protein
VNDENEYLPLDDTSLISLSLKDPNGNIKPVFYSGTLLTFYPASLGSNKNGDNEARVEYTPLLSRDGTYQLSVEANDKSKNTAGDYFYKVSFEVVNKPMISHILNYPNPFSTSTQFVFTLTGSEVPTYLKIQIFTVTGKIVKEITQNELGNVYIGRNISTYIWDGTDTYGDRLANGIYLYRVVSNIQGTEIEHFKTSVDHLFKSGFGKMYLFK